MKTISIKKKILFWMTTIGLVPLVIIACESHYFGHQAITESETGHLTFALKSRLIWLNEWLKFTQNEYLYAGQNSCPKEHQNTSHSSKRAVHRAIDSLAKGHANYELLAAFDTEWDLIANAIEHDIEAEIPSASIRKRLENGENFIVSSELLVKDDYVLLQIAQPVFDTQGQIFAYIYGRLNLTRSLDRILGDSGDFGHSGRLYLVSDEGRYLSHSFGIKNVTGQLGVIPEALLRGPYWQTIEYKDLQKKAVLGVSAPLKKFGWVLIAEVDKAEAFMWLNRAVLAGTVTGVIVLVFVFFLAVSASQTISRPLREMASASRSVSDGNLTTRIPEFQEKESREVSQAFNRMLDRLSVTQQSLANAVSLASVGALSSSVAHEMRNPLSSIKLNLQAISRLVAGDPTYSEMAEIALAQAERLELMLSELLTYGKPLKLQPVPTTFRSIAENAARLLKIDAGRKGVFIDIEDHLSDRVISVDKELMERALNNLLANAINWSEPEGIIQLIGSPDKDDEWFFIAVVDNGPGIPRDYLQKIFMPFFTTRQEGTGLGLAYVKKIIDHHGGTVNVSSGEKGGSIFKIILPFKGV